MATRLYLRDTQNNTTGYANTEFSTALPNGVLLPNNVKADLATTPGASPTSMTHTNGTSTAHRDDYLRKFISPTLSVASIAANTWTIAWGASQSNGNLNSFLVASIYVLTSGDTVRGFIYDSHTLLGAEFALSLQGRVVTVAGSEVAGVVATDRIAYELWTHYQSSMSTAYLGTVYYNGTTPPANLVSSSSPASYIETPQDLFAVAGGAPKPVVAPSLAASRASRW